VLGSIGFFYACTNAASKAKISFLLLCTIVGFLKVQVVVCIVCSMFCALPFSVLAQYNKEDMLQQLSEVEGEEAIDMALQFADDHSNDDPAFFDSLSVLLLPEAGANPMLLQKLKMLEIFAEIHYDHVETAELIFQVFDSGVPLTHRDSARMYGLLRNNYLEYDLYSEALEAHNKYISLCRKIGKNDEVLTSDALTASIYLGLKMYSDAVEIYKTLIDSCEMNDMFYWKANYINNIGVVHMYAGNYKKATKYYERCISFLHDTLFEPSTSSSNDSFFVNLVKGNIGQIEYRYNKNYKRAERLIKMDLVYSLKYDIKNAMGCYNSLGEIMLHQERYSDAFNYLKKGRSLAYKNPLSKPVIKNLQLLSDYYAAKGSFEKAYDIHLRYTRVSDSLRSVTDYSKAFLAQMKRDHDLKQLALKREQNSILKAEEEIKRRGSYLLVLLLALTVLSLLLLLIIRAYRQRAKRERELAVVNAEMNRVNQQVTDSLAEKEILIKELHHRVKNNLQLISSLLSIQLNDETQTEIIGALTNASNRVKSISDIHQQLYKSDSLSKIELLQYLKELAHSLQISFGQHSSDHFEVQGEDLLVEINDAISIGLICNELISNSIKHARAVGKPLLVKIVLSYGQMLGIHYTDNGKGKKQPGQQKKGTGMKLIELLTRQLHGVMQISFKEGVSFILTVPVKSVRA